MPEKQNHSDLLQRAWPQASEPSVTRQRRSPSRPDWYECVFRLACRASFWVFLLIVIGGTLMLLFGALGDPASRPAGPLRLPPVHEPQLHFGADDLFSVLAYGGVVAVFVLWLGRALRKITRETQKSAGSQDSRSAHV
jgi:hypothetical protein